MDLARAALYEVRAGPTPLGYRTALRAHERLTDAIGAGNGELAIQLARRHLGATLAFTMSAGDHNGIVAETVRDRPPIYSG